MSAEKSETREAFLRGKLQNFVVFLEDMLPFAVSEKSPMYELPKQDNATLVLWVSTYLVPMRERIGRKDHTVITEMAQMMNMALEPKAFKSEQLDKFFLYMECFLELAG